MAGAATFITVESSRSMTAAVITAAKASQRLRRRGGAATVSVRGSTATAVIFGSRFERNELFCSKL
jgi:hypothetical protein